MADHDCPFCELPPPPVEKIAEWMEKNPVSDRRYRVLLDGQELPFHDAKYIPKKNGKGA